MNWLRTHRRSAVICGLTLLVPLFLFLNTLVGLWEIRSGYQDDVERLVPKIARLQGLIGFEDQLRDSAEQARKESVKLVYPASSDGATVSAELQTGVRQLLSDAGLSVSNSQILPVREQADFDYISIRLTVEGELSALDEALAEIAKFRPLLLVESLEMRSVRSRRRDEDSQVVSATLQLLSLRAIL